MDTEPEVRDLTLDEINQIARKFLMEHNCLGSIPVPIEEIIDLDFGINIVPVPGLKRSYSKESLEIDAFITSDFKHIHVDDYVQDKVENRYRFTLAHEIGHMVLHYNLYKQYEFGTSAEWAITVKNMSADARDITEWQANKFAGLVLVPRGILTNEFHREVEHRENEIFEEYPYLSGVNQYLNQVIESSKDHIMGAVIDGLTRKFVVNFIAMKIRLEEDGLISRERW